jgi:serine/threonine-protein kinase HipA
MRGIDVIEQLTMGAARELGLVTAASTLAEFGGIRTFVSTRYDRELRDGVWHRLHQEDLCQALAVPPAKKYQRRDGGPGLAAFAGLLDVMPLIRDRVEAARAFFEGFVFNAVVAGTDAHAKNYSIMLDGERVRLAPLYDLASYAAYRAGNESIQLAMNVNGEYRIDRLGTEDFVRAATRLRIPGPEARDIVDRMRTAALGAFERARENLGILGADAEATADRLLEGIAGLPLIERG